MLDSLEVVGDFPFRLPEVVGVLHAQPDARTVAQELAKAQGDIRRDRFGLV